MVLRRAAVVVAAIGMTSLGLVAAQSREAPVNAPSSGVLSPATEPGARLRVSGIVVDQSGAPVRGASIYAYQTDAEGYYGVKPASDSANPRLKILLRSGPKGEWSFDTIRPGSYPGSRVPGHIHFEVGAAGFARKVFEIVFEGDPFVTEQMRSNPVFSVRPIEPGTPGHVTQRIVLNK